MAANATFTVRMHPELKKQAEIVCEEMGLTMSSAMTIFLKRLVKDRAIPFRVSAGDHFYSEENIRHLRAAAERMEAGKNVVHDIIEGDDI